MDPDPQSLDVEADHSTTSASLPAASESRGIRRKPDSTTETTSRPSEKIADRPHRITVALGAITGLVALCALVTAVISLSISMRTQRINRATGRAVVQISRVLPKDQGRLGIRLECQVTNMGKSVATDITIVYKTLSLGGVVLGYQRGGGKGEQPIAGLVVRDLQLPDLAPGASAIVTAVVDLQSVTDPRNRGSLIGANPYILFAELEYKDEATSEIIKETQCFTGGLNVGAPVTEDLVPCVSKMEMNIDKQIGK
jgi:hypothetical protein